jgi:pyridoxine kinase
MAAKYILSIQSEVVYGHVGNGAARFALQRHGFEVLVLPTVLLSNHPGHGRVAGETIPSEKLRSLLVGLESLGILPHVGAVLSGYLGETGHGKLVAEAVERIKAANAAAVYLCDPVFGDDGGAYAKPGVAETIARELVPVADILTPNAFELKSLTARQVADAATAMAAAKSLGKAETVVTSVPKGSAEIGAIAVQGSQAWGWFGARVPNPPHGTGDLLSALYLAWRCKGARAAEALAWSTHAVHRLALDAAAQNLNELPLIERQDWLVASDAPSAIAL